MNINEILAHLKSERDRLDQAIAALGGVSARRSGRKTSIGGSFGAKRRGGKRRMSASARKRLSLMLKKRWAERKKQGKAKL